MPAKSRAQQQAMAIALHAPSKLHAANKGLLKMSDAQLRDFAATKVANKPAHVKSAAKPLNRYGTLRGSR